MPAREAVSISLSPELHAGSERMPACGRVSDVLRGGLRWLDEREGRLDAQRAARLGDEAKRHDWSPSSA